MTGEPASTKAAARGAAGTGGARDQLAAGAPGEAAVATRPSYENEQERSPEGDRLPMSGLRVVDIGTFLAGPHAASILGEFGAEVLKALRHRDRTGQGQYIDAALFESALRCTDELAPAYGMFGRVNERHGPRTATT